MQLLTRFLVWSNESFALLQNNFNPHWFSPLGMKSSIPLVLLFAYCTCPYHFNDSCTWALHLSTHLWHFSIANSNPLTPKRKSAHYILLPLINILRLQFLSALCTTSPAICNIDFYPFSPIAQVVLKNISKIKFDPNMCLAVIAIHVLLICPLTSGG